MTDALKELQDTLAVDGYSMHVDRINDHAVVTLSAAEGVCNDCLVPKPVMKSFLSEALSLPDAQIELVYPNEATTA